MIRNRTLLNPFRVLLLATLGSCINAQAQDLEPVSISYTMSYVGSRFGNATVGQLETTLTKEDDSYSVYSTTKTQGLAAILLGSDLQETCDFKIEDGRAQSSNYSGGSKEKTDYQASFNWLERKIILSNEESLDMPQGYMIDNCNLPYATALLKDQGEIGQALYVLTEDRIRGYILKSSEQVNLETPVGEFSTVKIVLERELDPDKTLSLWLSSNHNYTPIKMEEKRESRTITLMVNRIDS